MFILLKELFERDNVPFPEWLSYENLEEDWKDSKYSFERNKHIWSLKTPLKDVRMLNQIGLAQIDQVSSKLVIIFHSFFQLLIY